MSDNLSNEQLELLRARDARIRALDTSLLVQQELRDSRSLNLILAAIEEDVAEAVTQFADANPHDVQTIGALQARVHRLVYIRRFLNFVQSAGETADAALREDDTYNSDEF